MKKMLKLEERLIVAADFKPPGGSGRFWVETQVLGLAKKLERTGVILKVNSALRACGHGLIDQIHNHGLGVFADLKLYDIPNTLETDGAFLRRSRPELLTTVCSAGVAAMSALQKELPETEVLGVTVLTSLNGADVQEVYGRNMDDTVLTLAKQAVVAGIGGWICSPREAAILRILSDRMTINTPAIRPAWFKDPKDDQNPERIMTPAKAIQAGADRIVVGRPILKASDPLDAVKRTLDEIASAVS
jgi:orotidine-5'-phosphate decarboxylase